MKLKASPESRVRLTASAYDGRKYVRSKTLMVYDTTPEELMKAFVEFMSRRAKKDGSTTAAA